MALVIVLVQFEINLKTNIEITRHSLKKHVLREKDYYAVQITILNL